MYTISGVTELSTLENFDAEGYRLFNTDLRKVCELQPEFDLQKHFAEFGEKEQRHQFNISKYQEVLTARTKKINLLQDKLNFKMPFEEIEANKLSFLSDELKKKFHIVETANISSNAYDPLFLEIVEEYKDGIILDCGAGLRNEYYSNIVNYEIANYWSTDVLGVGEQLPFKENTFDAIVSVAVLEHVKDPFQCSKEIIRVLKPGGKLFSAIPFLQPYHGYPHHYYNMTWQGHENLYKHALKDIELKVIDSLKPAFTLSWFMNSYVNGLPPENREAFLNMKVADLIGSPIEMLNKDFVKNLSEEANFELASGTLLTGIKK